MTIPDTDEVRYARRFVIHHPDHPDLHGVQFPSGRCIADHDTGLCAAVSVDDLTPPGGTVHWVDETPTQEQP